MGEVGPVKGRLHLEVRPYTPPALRHAPRFHGDYREEGCVDEGSSLPSGNWGYGVTGGGGKGEQE